MPAEVDLFSQIHDTYDRLPKKQKKIADYISTNFEPAAPNPGCCWSLRRTRRKNYPNEKQI